MKRIVLTGPKSSGKSNIGVRLAELVHLPFFDLDEVLEQVYADEHEGNRLPFREIYRRHGEQKFRELELSAAKRVSGMDRILLSTGGTTFNQESLREILVPDSYIVLLKNDPQILWERTSHKGIPSYLEGEADPRRAFLERVEKVVDTITPLAHMILDTKDLSIEDVAQLLDVELSVRKVLK